MHVKASGVCGPVVTSNKEWLNAYAYKKLSSAEHIRIDAFHYSIALFNLEVQPVRMFALQRPMCINIS